MTPTHSKTDHEFYFSVIIPTYNRREVLEMTLHALEEQTISKDDFEVIVVNDGSEDDTEDFLERYKNRNKLHFTYITKKNEGQGVARNTGFQVCDGEIILFLGDDHIPKKNLLEEHRKVHEKFFTENFVCLGSSDWHKDIEVTPYMEFLTDIGMQFKYKALEQAKIIDPTYCLREAEYKFFYTNNISLKRSLFEKEHFHNNLHAYGWEDIELGFRLSRDHNAVILYNAQAKAYHYHPMDFADMEKKMKTIGSSAVKVEKVNKKFKVRPRGLKKLVLKLISLRPVVWITKVLSGGNEGTQNYLSFGRKMYYYALMKHYFFKGVKLGKKA